MGMKTADNTAVPLCRVHHTELHESGNERAYFAIKGANAYRWAEQSWKRFIEEHGDGW